MAETCRTCEKPNKLCRCNPYAKSREDNIKRNEEKLKEIFGDFNKTSPIKARKIKKLRRGLKCMALYLHIHSLTVFVSLFRITKSIEEIFKRSTSIAGY
jgi:hypothetical protein